MISCYIGVGEEVGKWKTSHHPHVNGLYRISLRDSMKHLSYFWIPLAVDIHITRLILTPAHSHAHSNLVELVHVVVFLSGFGVIFFTFYVFLLEKLPMGEARDGGSAPTHVSQIQGKTLALGPSNIDTCRSVK